MTSSSGEVCGELTLDYARLHEPLKEWNLAKQKDILKRKQSALDRASKELGRTMKPRTITTIINPDTKTADVFVFEGFHLRIPWNSPEAKKAYKGTYAYSG